MTSGLEAWESKSKASCRGEISALPRFWEFVHDGTDWRINNETQQLVVGNCFQFHWALIKIFLSQCLDGGIFDPFFRKNDISVVYISNCKKRERRSSQNLFNVWNQVLSIRVTAKFDKVGLMWEPIPAPLIWCQITFTAWKMWLWRNGCTMDSMSEGWITRVFRGALWNFPT